MVRKGAGTTGGRVILMNAFQTSLPPHYLQAYSLVVIIGQFLLQSVVVLQGEALHMKKSIS